MLVGGILYVQGRNQSKTILSPENGLLDLGPGHDFIFHLVKAGTPGQGEDKVRSRMLHFDLSNKAKAVLYRGVYPKPYIVGVVR